MAQEILDYDQIIWKVFSVGVGSSIVILYSFLQLIEDLFFKILALTFGFSLLLYSSFLIQGYGWKKECLMRIYPDQNLKDEINGKFYFRTRFMAEFILLGIVLFYGYYFINVLAFSVFILTLLIFLTMTLISHVLR